MKKYSKEKCPLRGFDSDHRSVLSIEWEISDVGTYLLSLYGNDLKGDRGSLHVVASDVDHFITLIAAAESCFKAIRMELE